MNEQNTKASWNDEASSAEIEQTNCMDRFEASEYLWHYKQQVDKALQELNDRSRFMNEVALLAIACAMAKTEFPGDRKFEKVDYWFTRIRNPTSFDTNAGGYELPEEVVKRYSASGARGLRFAQTSMDAALKCLEALIAADEPLTNMSNNLHPVQLAQRINRLGISLFRGRVVGLPD
ncbi:hypothetical protein WNY59_15950 [Ahrensia kielensis]|uniref:Uncharacterized protein n=1 Tax=Ahrensia kielensis TaxID=76980 RepID=A0ABU9TAC5_9HYPH